MSRATRFLDACHLRPTDRTPIWLMRQAGRYQASYQALRQQHAFIQLCRTPELAAQVTVAAVDELGVKVETDFDGPDPYVIRTSGNALVLLGQGDRGTIYAVYDILQSVVGCRFVAPGPIGDIIPHRTTIVVPTINRLEEPAFRFRIGWASFLSTNTKSMVEYADWATKHRLHIFRGDEKEMSKRGGTRGKPGGR